MSCPHAARPLPFPRRSELMLLPGGALTTARALRGQQKAMLVIGRLAGTSLDHEHARWRDL